MKYITPKELVQWGLLFEINRSVLHPFGLALAVELTEDGEMIFSNDIWDCREITEGLAYEKETYLAGNKKFMDFLEEQGYELLSKRVQALNYLEQLEHSIYEDKD
jgi:hypothetical protein